ncbi:hypothetical protein RvY_02563 [Ramazzottius varieornatus]|uniref:Uncharacterized protein n=1 Tax=Ramazzottius varieornatus TaxID=947166 RepID=A0A1D1UK52_RAMVA|nr:hypothetical protein RvY_02563 [Ramazzottius varieornatus]
MAYSTDSLLEFYVGIPEGYPEGQQPPPVAENTFNEIVENVVNLAAPAVQAAPPLVPAAATVPATVPAEDLGIFPHRDINVKYMERKST